MAARKALLAATAVAVLTFVVACDGDTQTQPPPTSTTRSSPATTTTTSNPALPTHGAPRVTDPLDAEAFADEPCTSLTATQLKSLRLGAGHEGRGEDFDTSDWSCKHLGVGSARALSVSVNYYPNISTGLSYLYEEHADGEWPQWRPTEVDGYPAVFYSDKDPVPSPYECRLDVGISDSSLVNIWVLYVSHNRLPDTCAAATKAAQAVLSTIKSVS
ncbi:MAG: DUF3558 family protein [Actinophytocola sp.]|uniref:DUF3558 family protein n=1 Tax=Actinophytocola sp. TaxID=1872138 RepID=UPI003D6AAE9B